MCSKNGSVTKVSITSSSRTGCCCVVAAAAIGAACRGCTKRRARHTLLHSCLLHVAADSPQCMRI
jgi:hypothetical protein